MVSQPPYERCLKTRASRADRQAAEKEDTVTGLAELYAHDAGDAIVVQKYGGTSVGTIERIIAIAERVKAQREAQPGLKIALVVSAMAGETNRLVGLTESISPDIDPRNYDLAVSAGEQVSCALMASALDRVGLKGHAFLGYQLGIMTYGHHAKARIAKIDGQRLHDCWAEGAIPVIAGFQGMNENRDITTLGRGGSDTSAVALAVALGAKFCEINTDVAGVYTADPRSVPAARPIDQMDFSVMLEMASLGSKVLHSRSVELAAKFNMPVVVRSTFDQDPTPSESRGTLIMPYTEKQALEAAVVSGVTMDTNVVKFTLSGIDPSTAPIASLFSRIADLGINVDIIIHNRRSQGDAMSLGFTAGKGDIAKTRTAMEEWQQATGNEASAIEVDEALAKVSVVGLGMRSHPGVASKCFSVLQAAGIDILMVSTSEIKISCVVRGDLAQQASQVLHEAFID